MISGSGSCLLLVGIRRPFPHQGCPPTGHPRGQSPGQAGSDAMRGSARLACHVAGAGSFRAALNIREECLLENSLRRNEGRDRAAEGSSGCPQRRGLLPGPPADPSAVVSVPGTKGSTRSSPCKAQRPRDPHRMPCRTRKCFFLLQGQLCDLERCGPECSCFPVTSPLLWT